MYKINVVELTNIIGGLWHRWVGFVWIYNSCFIQMYRYRAMSYNIYFFIATRITLVVTVSIISVTSAYLFRSISAQAHYHVRVDSWRKVCMDTYVQGLNHHNALVNRLATKTYFQPLNMFVFIWLPRIKHFEFSCFVTATVLTYI